MKLVSISFSCLTFVLFFSLSIVQAQTQIGFSYGLKARDVAVDKFRTSYVLTQSSVQIFDSNNTFLRKISIQKIGNNALELSSIVVDPEGNIYVTESGNERIFVFDNAGNPLRNFGGFGQRDQDFRSLTAIDIGDSGEIYAADQSVGKIKVFDVNGNFIRAFGSLGQGDGQFQYLSGLALDDAGNIYTIEANANRVQVFTNDGVFKLKFGMSGDGDGLFNGPGGIAVDAQQNIYVSDFVNNVVQKFSSTGHFLSKFGARGISDGKFQGASGITVMGDRIFIADTRNDRVQIFDTNGNYESKIGGSSAEDGKLNTPVGVAFDSKENIYVADKNNYRIQVFNSRGIFIRKFGSFGSGIGQFSRIQALSIDREDNIYVIDNNRLFIFNNNFDFVRSFGQNGGSDGSFANPKSIAIDSDKNIYISDFQNSVVQIFTSSGTYVRKIVIAGSAAGIALDDDKNIYVANNTKDKVQVFSNAGTLLREFGSRGFSDRDFYYLSGIALDKEKNIYTFCSNGLKKFTNNGDYVHRTTGIIGDGPGEFFIGDPGTNHLAISTEQVIVNDGAFVQAFQISQELQFLQISDKTLGDPDFVLNATSSSGLPVTFSSSNPAIASISGSTITLRKSGTVVITAQQAGGGFFNAASSVQQSIKIFKGNQTINFAALKGKKYDDVSFTLTAYATSGLPIFYTTSNENVATISGNTLTIHGCGTIFITAHQEGNSDYFPAIDFKQDLTIGKASQTISFALLPEKKYDDIEFTLAAIASSTLPITYISSDVSIASISGSSVIIHKIGSVMITANQAGNENYFQASEVRQLLTIHKASQTISFFELPDVFFGDEPFEITATSSSGLPISYSSSNETIATINENIVTAKSIGETIITAYQEGNEFYTGNSVTQKLIINSITGIEQSDLHGFKLFPNPAADILTITAEVPGARIILVTDMRGRKIIELPSVQTGESNSINVSGLSDGLYFIQILTENGSAVLRFIKD